MTATLKQKLQPSGATLASVNPVYPAFPNRGFTGLAADAGHSHQSFVPTLRGNFQSEDWGYTTAGGFWSGNAQATGTNNQPSATDAHHPGIIQARSHASNANSGYGVQTGSSQLLLKGGEESNFVFRIDTTTGTRTIAGWFTAYTAPTDPASCLIISVDGTALTGVAIKATAKTSTGSALTITQGAWYRGRIVVADDAASATFYVYSMAGKLLWSSTVSTNIPTAALLHGWASSLSSPGGVTIISSFDYQDILQNLGSQRGVFTYPVVAYGDSHTYNSTYNVVAQYFPSVLSRSLNAIYGCNSFAYNYGVSGNSTCALIGTIAQGYADKDPAIAVIYCGTNDTNTGHYGTVQASPTPAVNGCTLEPGIAATMAVDSWIYVGANLVKIATINTNAITWTPSLGGAPASGTAVTPATQKNLETAITMLKTAGMSRILVCGQHYLNYASGGDTTSTQYTGGAALRALQKAAADAQGVPFVDLYAWMRGLVLAGTYTQGQDTAWHVDVGNSHLNAVGEGILANAVTSAIVANGWHKELIP